jgi:hypothetical protein
MRIVGETLVAFYNKAGVQVGERNLGNVEVVPIPVQDAPAGAAWMRVITRIPIRGATANADTP